MDINVVDAESLVSSCWQDTASRRNRPGKLFPMDVKRDKSLILGAGVVESRAPRVGKNLHTRRTENFITTCEQKVLTRTTCHLT